MWKDFVSGGGTALSPPLPIMVVLAAAIIVSRSSRWVGTVATAVLLFGGMAIAAGVAIEPVTHQVLGSHPDLVKTPLTALALLAAPATSVCAAVNLCRRRRGRDRRSASV